MTIAVTFTVNDRPDYFQQTLDSWSEVRGKENVVFYFNCEPFNYLDGNNRGTCVDMAEKWIKDNKVVGRAFCNSVKFGVLHNPYIALQRAFGPAQFDYAILAEDDLLVSDDLLEYHKWARQEYRNDRDIAMVCSFMEHEVSFDLTDKVIAVPNFASVWLWGTWRDRWVDFIEPTWDHDYSTADEAGPGGWDWHLNKRILPKLNKSSIVPLASRAQNIGQHGTHSDILVESRSYVAHREPVEFSELTRR